MRLKVGEGPKMRPGGERGRAVRGEDWQDVRTGIENGAVRDDSCKARRRRKSLLSCV